jgi:hypothetical protein
VACTIGGTKQALDARSASPPRRLNVPLTEQRDVCTVRAVTSALPVPKYHQVCLVAREQLHEGRFSGGVPGEIASGGAAVMRNARGIR